LGAGVAGAVRAGIADRAGGGAAICFGAAEAAAAYVIIAVALDAIRLAGVANAVVAESPARRIVHLANGILVSGDAGIAVAAQTLEIVIGVDVEAVARV
jgi:hypothetical protein